MTLKTKTACIFGGTGFIGRQVVRVLAREDYQIKITTRIPERAFTLRTAGVVGQIVSVACDYSEQSIADAVKGCDVVINLIGILYEKGKSKFQRAHVDIPQMIAQACAAQGVARFVHVSALGIEQGVSQYARTKRDGEMAVRRSFPRAVILRPSVVFGPEDGFFNMFACMARFLPALPLIGGGQTKFQPVYVCDVAEAIGKIVTMPPVGDKNPEGKTYELGGPEILTLKQVYERMFRETARRRVMVSLPFPVARVQGALMGLLPKPPLTADQVDSLKADSVVSSGALTFDALGLRPRGLDTILPTYLARFRPGGRFGDRKLA